MTEDRGGFTGVMYVGWAYHNIVSECYPSWCVTCTSSLTSQLEERERKGLLCTKFRAKFRATLYKVRRHIVQSSVPCRMKFEASQKLQLKCRIWVIITELIWRFHTWRCNISTYHFWEEQWRKILYVHSASNSATRLSLLGRRRLDFNCEGFPGCRAIPRERLRGQWKVEKKTLTSLNAKNLCRLLIYQLHCLTIELIPAILIMMQHS